MVRKTHSNGSLQLAYCSQSWSLLSKIGQRRAEPQVREGSFIESIRIVCSNLFRKLAWVSRTGGRRAWWWCWGCQYQHPAHPLMCLHKHSSHWVGLTRPRAKFDQICRNYITHLYFIRALCLVSRIIIVRKLVVELRIVHETDNLDEDEHKCKKL